MRIVRKSSSKPKRSKLEERFAKVGNFPPLGDIHAICPREREYKFHPTRRWLFDFAWPSVKVAVEIQGGGFMRGKHNRGVGQQNDFDKLNEAQRLGWVVLQFGPTHLSSIKKCQQAVIYVAQILKDRLDAQANKRQATPPYTDFKPTSTTTIYGTEQARPRRRRPPKPIRRPRSSMV